MKKSRYTANQITNLANCLRFLSLDIIENAKSGHPGAPLGLADIVATLFANHFKFDVSKPRCINRDKFILSNGHASAMLYSLLYLVGYKDITIQDLKDFRKIHSKTTGHPEFGLLDGVETTTGPLGQGIANAVGIAIADKYRGSKSKTYCIVGDGCLMEGVSYEAICIASVYNLDNLVLIFDDNNITIDGNTFISTRENIVKRFEANDFNIISIDGHNIDEINNAFIDTNKAKKPTVIIAKTKIGYGLDFECKPEAHGGSVSKNDIDKMKSKLNWESDSFQIPSDLMNIWRSFSTSLQGKEISPQNNNKAVKELQILKENALKSEINEATRKSSGRVIEALANYENMIFGSADLGSSTCMKSKNMKDFSSNNYSGNYINYGIREHAMAAISNGLALNGALPFLSTFMVFSDYMRPAIRLSAMMNIPVCYVFTHDSIGVGEDGPTHQPIEHLSSLRAIPELITIRPADFVETIEAYQYFLSSKKPCAMCFSRQDVKYVSKFREDGKNLLQYGAYNVFGFHQKPDIILIASGSEVCIAVAVAEKLSDRKINVVSMPSINLFDKQSNRYKNKVLKSRVKKIFIEAGSSMSAQKYMGKNDRFIGVDGFGFSGKASDIYQHFGIIEENIIKNIEEMI